MFQFMKYSNISILQSESSVSQECLNNLCSLFNRHCSHFSAHGICHENVCKNDGSESCSSPHWHLIIINLCIICDYKTTEICYCKIGCQVSIASPESLRLSLIMEGFFFLFFLRNNIHSHVSFSWLFFFKSCRLSQSHYRHYSNYKTVFFLDYICINILIYQACILVNVIILDYFSYVKMRTSYEHLVMSAKQQLNPQERNDQLSGKYLQRYSHPT